MGYFFHGLIASQHLLVTRAKDWECAAVVPLAQGLAVIPLTDELLDEIGSQGNRGRFERLTPNVSSWVISISTVGQVAYMEAEFFGGVGGQSAVVFGDGRQILSLHSLDAINEALRIIRVSSKGYFDEFEAVGLPRHRNTEDWLTDAIKRPQ